MCDENCVNLEPLTKLAAEKDAKILQLVKERDFLKEENVILKEMLCRFEKGLNEKTIIENETPDASDSEYSDGKKAIRTPNQSETVQPKPASLSEAAKNEVLGTKRERSSSDADADMPARKKKSNFGKFKCPAKNPSCDHRFISKELCQEHQMDEEFHQNLKFPCDRCSLVLPSNKTFKNHQKTHRWNDKKFLEQENADAEPNEEDSYKEPKVNEGGKWCLHCNCVIRMSNFSNHFKRFH